jgi:hypothetical protein
VVPLLVTFTAAASDGGEATVAVTVAWSDDMATLSGSAVALPFESAGAATLPQPQFSPFGAMAHTCQPQNQLGRVAVPSTSCYPGIVSENNHALTVERIRSVKAQAQNLRPYGQICCLFEQLLRAI